MMLGVVATAKPNRKRQWKSKSDSLKKRRTEFNSDSPEINAMVKNSPACLPSALSLDAMRTDTSESGQGLPGFQGASTSSDHRKAAQPPAPVAMALGEHWESDSGFSSETSPPASGRSSPTLCPCPGPEQLVSLDCEMVGTGPRGSCSELARCSILDYGGVVLYDKYVRPCQPVTDYRTRWSGIQRHHLQNAVPFTQAREEVRGRVLKSLSDCLGPCLSLG